MRDRRPDPARSCSPDAARPPLLSEAGQLRRHCDRFEHDLGGLRGSLCSGKRQSRLHRTGTGARKPPCSFWALFSNNLGLKGRDTHSGLGSRDAAAGHSGSGIRKGLAGGSGTAPPREGCTGPLPAREPWLPRSDSRVARPRVVPAKGTCARQGDLRRPLLSTSPHLLQTWGFSRSSRSPCCVPSTRAS